MIMSEPLVLSKWEEKGRRKVAMAVAAWRRVEGRERMGAKWRRDSNGDSSSFAITKMKKEREGRRVVAKQRRMWKSVEERSKLINNDKEGR